MRYTDFEKQTVQELREIHAEFLRLYEVAKQACENGFQSDAANGVLESAVDWIQMSMVSEEDFSWETYEEAYIWDTAEHVAQQIKVSVKTLIDICIKQAPSAAFMKYDEENSQWMIRNDFTELIARAPYLWLMFA